MSRLIFFLPLILAALLPLSLNGADSATTSILSSQPGQTCLRDGNRSGIGRPAPDFTLDAVISGKFEKVSLSAYRGKWLVLFFYPLDFSYVCPTEIKGFNASLDAFHKLNTEVLAVSVDSKYAHLAWIQRGDLGNLRYPLLSDITKDVSARYGILDTGEGVSLRGLFIIDPQGTIQYQLVHSLSVGRSVQETLRVLEALQTGEMCPVNWKRGEKTLGK